MLPKHLFNVFQEISIFSLCLKCLFKNQKHVNFILSEEVIPLKELKEPLQKTNPYYY